MLGYTKLPANDYLGDKIIRDNLALGLQHSKSSESLTF